MFDPHVDHIFPQNIFLKRVLVDGSLVHRLANLQLLTARENQEKSDKDFQTWLESRDAKFLDQQLIPKDKGLWAAEEFEAFVGAREKLIREKLSVMFTKKPDLAEADPSLA